MRFRVVFKNTWYTSRYLRLRFWDLYVVVCLCVYVCMYVYVYIYIYIYMYPVTSLFSGFKCGLLGRGAGFLVHFPGI